jgi:hypothetical protein
VTKFRQPIFPGDVGSDVWAVKRAYISMGVSGSGTLAKTKRAGSAFVAVTQIVQRQHSLKADGIYGAATHAVVAPHFDRWGAALYRSAAIRHHTPPAPTGSTAAARRLLVLHGQGKYRADNPGDLNDIEAAARGAAVWSRAGRWVHIDRRPLELLVWLIDKKGYQIGTFAICSDHSNDGPHGHAGGLAVDISSVNGVSIASHAEALTLQAAKAIRDAPGLRPRQLICGGSGYVLEPSIYACCIPSAEFYGWTTVREHTNHIHAGY